VVGHIGLTPQSVYQLGGYKVQGRDLAAAQKLMADAIALQEAGAFAVVLECVPEEVAGKIAKELTIPVIGIGSGAGCDGQVLVFHDLVGYASQIAPSFVKRYADVGGIIREAVAQYVRDVEARAFPGPEHVFHAAEDTIKQLYGEGAEEQ